MSSSKDIQKVIVFPQLNGWNGWSSIKKDVFEYDHIVFMGSISSFNFQIANVAEQRTNIEELFTFKFMHPERVHILLGPEDIKFLDPRYKSVAPSREKVYNEFLHEKITRHSVYNSSYTFIDYCLQIGNYIFSYGGFTDEWLSLYLDRLIDLGLGLNGKTFGDFINVSWRIKDFSEILLNHELVHQSMFMGPKEAICPLFTNWSGFLTTPAAGLVQVSASMDCKETRFSGEKNASVIHINREFNPSLGYSFQKDRFTILEINTQKNDNPIKINNLHVFV